MQNPSLDSFGFKNPILYFLEEVFPQAQEEPVLNLKYNWDGRDKLCPTLNNLIVRAHAFWASCDQAPDALNEIKHQT